ncbi:hypothetical protein COU60_03235 [Candidatus Pacearchaeota archaeon CG10_big_fil_rev_8_21_14_0_10_34_76]|nr:MAG: hypothetical protein COU60_03235 [Candidatus Pacearchaeota archaeon CG10_big_fil_rev_8_21_14_0_10_34_76]
MSIKSVLKDELECIIPDEKIVKQAKDFSKLFIQELNKELGGEGLEVQIFVGGSFAKNTFLKKDKYDVDVYVRFDWKYDNISKLLEKSLKRLCDAKELKYESLHGSRDYFRVFPSKEGNGFYIELIPVTKIRNPREARNVTDLSYFHVSYLKRKAKGLENEIRLAKRFMQAQNVYGAESYVHGFSGYAIECLIIHYKSFEKMLKELVKVKHGERLVIDIEKHYKRKNDVFFELNESKLHSPVIIVDPTFKERNALASLNRESFKKFQESAEKFLKNPDKSYFIEKSLDLDSLEMKSKKNNSEYLRVLLRTDRQKGDIAGTKLKKFHYFLEEELKRYFEIIEHHFVYNEDKGQRAEVHIILKPKKEIIMIGPPVNPKDSKKKIRYMEKHVEAFKRAHKDVFKKNGFWHAREKVNFNGKGFLTNWVKNNGDKMKEMGVTELKVD